MAENERKGPHQKLKMLYLAKIFYEETDDAHSLTVPQIADKLAAYGVNADRKTLYLDFEELRFFGLDIIQERSGRVYGYHLGNRRFELVELKLLVDSVQSAKFITDKKSKELIRKLESFAGKYEAKQLHRQVLISGRVKAMNESIYYNVDKLHTAINADRRVRFKYYRWTVKKTMEPRKGDSWYEVSPWILTWDDENYYLIAFDESEKKIKHYRVDKMRSISITGGKRNGREAFRDHDAPRYSKSLFGMNGGEMHTVTIEADNDMAGALIDRFGKEIEIVPKGADRFVTRVNVSVSPQFFGWIMALGEGVRLTDPPGVVSMMKKEAKRLFEEYCEKNR